MLSALLSLTAAKFYLAIAYANVGFFILISAGLFRDHSVDGLVIGTWLATSSGLLWYMAAVAPIIWPTRTLLSAAFNIGAAFCAAGSALFLVPDDRLPLVRNAFGLN